MESAAMNSPLSRLTAFCQDFGNYVFALFENWILTLTGGVIIASLMLWSLLGSSPLPPSVNWLALAATLILASFLAWRKEHKRKADADSAARALRERLVDKIDRERAGSVLAALITELRHHDDQMDRPEEWFVELVALKSKVRQRVSETFGEEEAEIVFSHRGNYDHNFASVRGAGLEAHNEIRWLIEALTSLRHRNQLMLGGVAQQSPPATH